MRNILGWGISIVGLAIAVFAILPRSLEPIQRGRRSVLLITLDTTRADRLGAYGADDVETPNLDRIAEHGTTMENAFAVSPITLPAHASIMTGLYPFQTGVRNNGTHRVPARLTTLAERMQTAGFRTAAFVSASVLDRRYGLDEGFELYDDNLASGRERHPRVVPDRPAEATVASAASWLDTVAQTEAFFCWVHLYDPHAVYSPPPPFRDRYRERLYDGEIAYMDEQIGRLMEHPRIAEDSDLVVIAVGDHGESLGEHGERTHGILAYDSTLHVPLIVRFPGSPSGSRIADAVSQIDILPTVLDLLGVQPDPELPGRSMIASMESGEETPPRGLYSETYLPFYTYGWAKLRVLRFGRWKYISSPEPELFDVRRDPRELSNLAQQREGRAHDLRRELEGLVSASDEVDQDATLDLDLDSLEMLRALGYAAMGTLPPRDEAQRPDPKQFIGLHTSLERARAFLDDQLFEEAESELQSALAADPDNIAFLRELGAALEGQGRFDEAADTLQRALSVDPSAASLYLGLSRLENRRGNTDRALEIVDSALERDQNYLEANLQRAQLLSVLGRREEAQEILERALERDPENPLANFSFVQLIELPAGQWDAAEDRLGRVLAQDPFMAPAWLRLGQIQQRQGRIEEAVTSFRSGLERAPDSVDLHASLGTILASTGGGSPAEQHLREAIRLSRTFRPELHVTLGAWLTEHGRPSQALREYEQVLDRLPHDSGALNNRAIALFQVGRIEEAERDLLALARDDPDNADVFNNLAAVAMSREDWVSMEVRARRAVELDPKMVEAWSNLGIACSRSGRLREAEESFRTALELRPSYWQARFNLAAALARAGRAEEAVEYYLEVLGQDPDLSDAYLELGKLYRDSLDDPTRARNHFNAFLRHVPPDDSRVVEVRRQLEELSPASSAPAD